MEKRESFAHAISDILVKHKIVNEVEGRALQRSFKNSDKENFDEFLLEEGLVEEAALLNALSDYYQVPAVDVTGYFFDTELLSNFPKDFLLRNSIIPLEMEDDILIIVANNPDNTDLLPALGVYTSEDIQFRVGLGRDICDSVKEFYDTSLTEVMDEQDLVEERLEQDSRYRSLLGDEDQETNSTLKQEIDTDEEL